MLINSIMPLKDNNGKKITTFDDMDKSSIKASLQILDHATLRIGSSFIYNVFLNTVEPVIGSLIYCKLAMNQVEHSGIYVGDGQIVHLDGSGLIEIVSASKFLERLDGLNIATSIYVSCKNSQPIGLKEIAERAKAKVGQRIKYNLFFNNCHKFSASCITGNENENIKRFSDLRWLATKHIDFDDWRVWDNKSSSFRQTTAAIEVEKSIVLKSAIALNLDPDLVDLIKLAEAKNIEAQNEVADRYFKGIGISKNFVKTFEWSKLAAENGNIESQIRLSILYEKGWGTKRDIALSNYWKRQAKQ